MTFRESIGNTNAHFEQYQENGTIFIKNIRVLPEHIFEDLIQCAGEIFLSGIPESTEAEQIASIACKVGEVYMIRYKVNLARQSRGFAYLQYVDPNILNLALQSLPELFARNGLESIRVVKSKNSSKLVLRNVYKLSPVMVKNMLANLIKFRKITSRFLHSDKYEYQIDFGSNVNAVRAKRIIMKNIYSFGSSARITWDSPSDKY